MQGCAAENEGNVMGNKAPPHKGLKFPFGSRGPPKHTLILRHGREHRLPVVLELLRMLQSTPIVLRHVREERFFAFFLLAFPLSLLVSFNFTLSNICVQRG